MKGTNIVILMFLLLVLSPPLISKAEEIKSLNSLSVRLDSLRKSLVMYTHLKDEILKMAENNDKLNENDIEELIKLSKILSEYTSMELNTDPNDVSYQQKLNALADKFYEEYKNRSSKLPTESPRQQPLPELRQQPLSEFSDSARDDALEPEMVMIPAGSFLMGSPLNEPGRFDHERQHEVEVKAFAIGKYEVTFEEYDRFAKATKREKPSDYGWGRGRRPVIDVTWDDAVAYANWLSQQTGKSYRLPTEAEWEYAARAGTTTPFYFGNTIDTDQANYNGNYAYNGGPKGTYWQKTVEVGLFPANSWGLYDVHGNVWEWTCSVYDENYGGGEQRCAEPGTSGPCVLRGGSWDDDPGGLRGAARLSVLRGGSWSYEPRRGLRGPVRGWYNPRGRGGNLGFRLARTFP